jgi:phthalate 4,5-dioxygenase reductase component
VVDTMSPDALSLRIARKEQIAHDIYLFELQDHAGGDLLPFTAGAYLKLRTPNGLVREYSMCNDPAERSRYTIAVKREMSGRGGSIDIVDHTRVDDTLLAAPPR